MARSWSHIEEATRGHSLFRDPHHAVFRGLPRPLFFLESKILMPDSTQQPEGEPLIRAIAMPADANPSGDIFGGWLMSQMDLAAANAASRRCRGRCATVAVDGMIFHEPVFVGDEVSLYCRILRVGRTSMTIRVDAWRRSRTEVARRKVTEAVFTFVATDDDRKPRPVPPE
jgi:acyl-CoA thioesterase YciA